MSYEYGTAVAEIMDVTFIRCKVLNKKKYNLLRRDGVGDLV